MENAISPKLYKAISFLMEIPELKKFNLGGGTNLGLKYNHRSSTDIDLFSNVIVGSKALNINGKSGNKCRQPNKKTS